MGTMANSAADYDARKGADTRFALYRSQHCHRFGQSPSRAAAVSAGTLHPGHHGGEFNKLGSQRQASDSRLPMYTALC